jgi:DNA repair photolyase
VIISASRRTDIPAFYHRWFMNRIREEFLLSRNPFNANQISRVSLKPQDVDVIVFWTRNPAKLIQELPVLDQLGHKYYFQYTITGYPRTIEAAVPKPDAAIATFSQLSDLIGKNKVVWRYDPILLSNQVDIEEHKRLFSKIASLLAGKTERVVISFSDFYNKTERNLRTIENLVYSDITKNTEQLLELSRFMANVASKNGMRINSCAEYVDLASAGIGHGKCIDDDLINEVFGLSLSPLKDKGQRDECGCVRSIDIGSYNTCLHECSYCYATFNKKSVIGNRKKHDENSPFLIGGADDVNPALLAEEKIEAQRDLF